MRGQRLRLRTTVVGLFALVASFVVGGSAQAREPLRYSDHRIELACDLVSNDAGTMFLFLASSEVFGPFADLAFWPSDREPFEDPPTLVADFETPPTVSVTDSSLTAEIPLTTLGGDPQGDALISATLTPAGDPEPLQDERFGNKWIRQEGTIQQMTVDGTATLPDGTQFSLDACTGSIRDVTAFETDPNSFVDPHTEQFFECGVDTGSAFVILSASEDSGFIAIDSIEGLLIGEGPIEFSRRQLSGTIPLHEESLEGDVIGEAVIDATLTVRERVNISTQSQTHRDKVIATLFDVAGTVTLEPSGDQITLTPDACFAFDSRHVFADHNPRGPKPGGKAPANDAPGSALPLTVGSHLTQQTGGAAEEAEEGCVAADEFTVPLGRTVWYSIVGTGGPITIDTEGSNFDTVIGVYSESLKPLACVDDVRAAQVGFSLQSVVTLEDTDPGTTYLVQIGGFAAEFGTLKVAVS